MHRRTAIKTLGTLGAATCAPRFLSACGGSGDEARLGITNVVILMMENRSYDHFLGARALLEGLPGDGMPPRASNKNRLGEDIEAYAAGDPCVLDPPHSWDAARLQLGGGACDGFVVAYQDSSGDGVVPDVMSYLTRDQVPVSWALADAYASCDRWFSSVLGPTWPNRMYLHSAQSSGLTDNQQPASGFNWTTIWHRMDDAGIDWAYYMSDVPVIAVAEDLDLEGRIRRVMWDFIDDAAAGKLPPVSVVEPAFSSNDDHPPHHPGFGQQFISLIYNALARSPQWPRTLFVVTYDEHGGFYDHVAPPKAADDRAEQGFDQLGFRVPALAIGPWVRPGFVSSAIHDHTSVLAHLEKMFDLEPLTARDAAARDLDDCIDSDRLAGGAPLAPVEVPAVELDESQLGDLCLGGTLKHDVLEWADGARLPARWDLRARARDTIHEIAEVLDAWNLGRIRRGR